MHKKYTVNLIAFQILTKLIGNLIHYLEPNIPNIKNTVNLLLKYK